MRDSCICHVEKNRVNSGGFAFAMPLLIKMDLFDDMAMRIFHNKQRELLLTSDHLQMLLHLVKMQRFGSVVAAEDGCVVRWLFVIISATFSSKN